MTTPLASSSPSARSASSVPIFARRSAAYTSVINRAFFARLRKNSRTALRASLKLALDGSLTLRFPLSFHPHPFLLRHGSREEKQKRDEADATSILMYGFLREFRQGRVSTRPLKPSASFVFLAANSSLLSF